MYKIQKIVKQIPSMSLFVLLMGFSCWRPNVPSIPKNVILFIGDGMGVSHITAAMTVKGKLNLEEFKVAGLLTTYCENRFITDSGAAATALATVCLATAWAGAVAEAGGAAWAGGTGTMPPDCRAGLALAMHRPGDTDLMSSR